MNPVSDIRYIDFHTHRLSGSSETITIMNLMAGEEVPSSYAANALFSAGIHPWQLTGDNHVQLEEELLLTAAHPHVVMIGEAGFDRTRGAQGEIQYRVFMFQASLAAELGKPMVIHCVRGWDDLMRAFRKTEPVTPWVIHGYRGSSKKAARLAEEGFWFSLGREGLTADIIKAVRHDRIMLETDDSGRSIADIYRHFAFTAECNEDEAAALMRENFNTLFNFAL